MEQKYCKYCGELIDNSCIICPKCGKQIEELNVYGTQSGMITQKIEYSLLLDIFLLLFLTPFGLLYVLCRPKTKLVPVEEYNAKMQEKERHKQELLEKKNKKQQHKPTMFEDFMAFVIGICIILVLAAIILKITGA